MAYIDPGMQPPAPPAAMNGGLGAPAALPPLGGASPEYLPPQQMMQQRPQPKISKEHKRLLDWSQSVNIAEELMETDEGEDTLSKIAHQVKRGYDRDLASLDEYLAKNRQAFELATQVAEKKTYPWPEASNVVFPLVTSAALSFASRAYPAIIADRNVVRGVVYGNDRGTPMLGEDGTPAVVPTQTPGPYVIPGPPDPQTGQPIMLEIQWSSPPGEKRRRADRIGQHMSYQLLDQKTGWENDTDKLLHMLPIAGCLFRKTWYQPMQRKTLSNVLTPKQLIVNYNAKSMERAPRLTEEVELYPNEVESLKRQGIFCKVELDRPKDAGDDDDAPHQLLEQHCWYDLDDDGYREPYIVTIDKDSLKVLRILARYDAEGIKVKEGEDDEIVEIEPVHYYTKYDFIPNIEGGFHGMGFGQLLMPINASINTTLNMMIDAGHLQTVGGGFMGKGVSMHSGSTRFKLGEWKVVNAPGSSIKDAIVPLPAPGPSDVLFQLLGLLIKAGEQIAGTNDVLEGATNMATAQPTTMLALIEQGLKVFTAIYKRVYLALKDEYEKRYRLNRLHMEEREEYQYGDDWREVTREDYKLGSGVCPYSDPKMVSDMQRMARAQILLSLRQDPLMEGKEILTRVLEAADIEDPETLFAGQPQPDPVIVSQVEKTVEETKKIKSDIQLGAIQEATERSKQVLNYANAIAALSKADVEQADKDLNWIGGQLEVLRFRMESANGQTAGAAGAGGVPAGLPPVGEGAEEQPPLEGAQRAPDGQWYVPDPEREGKYLQVMANGG
jgi:chaperonin GroES